MIKTCQQSKHGYRDVFALDDSGSHADSAVSAFLATSVRGHEYVVKPFYTILRHVLGTSSIECVPDDLVVELRKI